MFRVLRWVWYLIVGLALVGSFVVASTVVDAQAATNQPADGVVTVPDGDRVEDIDSQTVLLDADFDDDDGTATVEIFSRVRQTVYVVDGSYVMKGGTMTYEARVVPANSTVTVTIPVRPVRGWIMLSVATENTRGYGVPIDKPLDLLPGSPGKGDAPAAGLGVALGVILVASVAFVFYRFHGGGVEHEF